MTRCGKRLFDLIASSVGLVLLTPLLLAIGVLIRLSSQGPAIYSQVRVGRDGSVFRVFKFRTMVVDAEKRGSSVTSSSDPRITPFGRLLRRSKLDELPQLWNVFKGDMSLVGPRPDTPEIVATYTPAMRRILGVRPGITSVASLHLREEEDLLALARDHDEAYVRIVVPAKLEIAMQHVETQSFLFDLGVLLKTVWALTGGRFFPTAEHPVVADLRTRIMKEQAGFHIDS